MPKGGKKGPKPDTKVAVSPRDEETDDSQLQRQILHAMETILGKTAAMARQTEAGLFATGLRLDGLSALPKVLLREELQGGPRLRGLTTSDLDEFTKRSAARLHATHSSQLIMAWIVFGLTAGAVIAGFVMFFLHLTTYATISGASGLGGFWLMQWKWQPFDRATQAMRTAECFESNRIVFNQQLADVEKIEDPSERMTRRAKAVATFNADIKRC